MRKLVPVVALLLPLVDALPVLAQGVQLPAAPTDAPVPGTVPPGGVSPVPPPPRPVSPQQNRAREQQARRRALHPPPGSTPLR